MFELARNKHCYTRPKNLEVAKKIEERPRGALFFQLSRNTMVGLAGMGSGP